MNITVEERNGISIVKLEGDMTAESPFVEETNDLLAKEGHKVVVDLSGVGMVSSAGLGDLVRVTAQSNSQGGRLVLANPAPFVAGVFENTKLNKFFDIQPSIDEAIASIQ